MKTERLIDFILEANKVGYAAEGGVYKVKESDGSTSITYECGPWRFHDNYFGGEPFGGRTVISLEGKPAWFMAYWGGVSETVTDIERVYRFLQAALKRMPRARPFRGPSVYREGSLTYHNDCSSSDVEKFSGDELIKEGKRTIYRAVYFGGLVDQRPE